MIRPKILRGLLGGQFHSGRDVTRRWKCDQKSLLSSKSCSQEMFGIIRSQELCFAMVFLKLI